MSPELEQVIAWLRSRNPRIGRIDPDYDLIENRLIDSLGFVEFIILIEKLSGRTLNVDDMNIDSLRSLASIERTFFTGPSGNAPAPPLPTNM
jgi:acyl carrier protein